MASVSDKAGMIGITEKDFQKEPITKGADFEIYKTAAGTEVTLNKSQCEQRKLLVKQMEERGFDAIIEEVAYTWFNRICAIRFMEVNDYLPTRVRVLSSEKDGKIEPDIVTQAPDVALDFTPEEKDYVIELKLKSDSKSQDELFKFLFIKQCNKLHEILPELFENTADYSELLLDISYTNKDEIVYHLVNDKDGIAESDFNISIVDKNGEKTGQVEIIGWLYQYYISEKHNLIVNIYKGTVKKEDIPAVTQLFTTDWVVRYMVDNSLGRYWIERNPKSKLAEKLQYFITPKDGHIEYVDEKIDPTELTFFDPCMGSGHILVYAFDVLMEIYRECGYSDRDAALNIVQFNLYGLDIDRRAHQLAYFAVMMKARSYNRRALTQGLFNNIAGIEESNTIDNFYCEGITEDAKQNEIGQYLVKAFLHAREIGSLQTIEEQDYKTFAEYLLNIEKKEVQLNMFSVDWVQNTLPLMLKLTKQAAILSRKYKVVCTNPPYMNKLESHLKKFVVDNYKDYSGDLFSVFIYRNFDFCVKDGYSAFMTPFVWMFIKTYEKLREYIINNKAISSLIQMEYSAFEEATVPICSFVLKNDLAKEPAYCIRLSDFKGGMEVQKNKVLEALKNKQCSYYHETEQANFKKIPGEPIAYWVGESIFQMFNADTMENHFEIKAGMCTGENATYILNWQEVDFSKTYMKSPNNYMYTPHNKGGEYRKWYGNRELILKYNAKALAKMQKNEGFRHDGKEYYFKEHIGWSKITSGNSSFRMFEEGFTFDSAGLGMFSKGNSNKYTTLAFLNSNVARELILLLNPTLNVTPMVVKKLPYIHDENRYDIKNLVEQNIEICKCDWDSFETSWDFKRHPIVETTGSIENRYAIWSLECDKRFNRLKQNEEKLNQDFIDIFRLQNELNTDVEDKDITVRKADLQRDIKSLLSYAVGCMFGRYSLDKEGLVYAGGTWEDTYSYYGGTFADCGGISLDGSYTFGEIRSKFYYYPVEGKAPLDCWKVDADNIIPITDEEYFEDDVVGLLCKWLKQVYGKESLEENLDFIAKALGNKGDSSREIIRNYFLKDFFADHCKVYQKRPIYWLFDSGKENGFKALVYLHRYDADTVGRVRIDYLHKQQSYVESALRSAEYTIDNSTSSSEKSKATKAVAKYTKQLAEMRLYDEAIAHIANQRIELDLDDGVKVNYEKFQGIEVSREGQKAVKINLLAKIK